MAPLTKASESQIKKAICDWLNLQVLTHAIRINTTGVPIGSSGKFRTNRSKGVADILICKDGKFGALEVKVPGNKPTGEQTNFLQRIAQVRGYAAVVYSLDDAIQCWKEM